MKSVLRIFSYLKYYVVPAVLNVVFNLLHVVFNLGAYVLIIPFVQLMFGLGELPAAEPEFGLSQSQLTGWAFWHLEQYRQMWGIGWCLVAVGAGYLLFTLLSDLFNVLAGFAMATIRNGVVERVRNDVYRRITLLPVAYFTHQRQGDLISRMSNDLTEVEISVVSLLQSVVKEALKVLVFGITLCVVSWRLFLLFLVVLPLGVWLIARIAKSLKKNSQRGQSRLGQLFATLEESLSAVRTIKAFGREAQRSQQFKQQNASLVHTFIRIASRRELSAPLSEVLGTLGLVFILVVGGWQVIDGYIMPSVFIFFVIVFARIIPPIQSLIKSYNNFVRGSASAARLFEVIDADEVITEAPNAFQLPTFEHAIEYQNVSFGFEPGTEVLHQVSFRVERGQTVAIVGPSGAGKSTLVDLLSRFYDCTSGSILIDGHPVQELNINSLRRQFGLVSQNCILFNDTVANNIAFGSDAYSRAEVEAAARLAHAHDFIEALPQGYDTPVGDRGTTLSGGQRQRISIARAVLKNPPVLILDEATSALDSESEQAVQQGLAALMQGRTSIVIAHRLSTIQNADLILVLDHGHIVERGTHADLLQQGGLYAHLVQMQSFD